MRTRRCLNSTSHHPYHHQRRHHRARSSKSGKRATPTAQSMCSGPYKQFRICNIQACHGGEYDIRKEECAKYNTRPFNNRRYKWVPKEGAEELCELVCKASGYDFHARLAKRVPDGARCGESSICIRGECRSLGCDGVVDSGATRDACGLCNGEGKSCQTYSGIFMRTEVVNDLLNVVTIPAGSSHLNVTDLKPTMNYYVVQDSIGQVILDGSRQIEVSKDYDGLGTKLTYMRPGGGRSQVLLVSGRITESLRLFVCCFALVFNHILC